MNKGKDHEKFTIEAGKSLYNGQEALNYTRYREDSDFNRTKRQQVFIDVVANKMLSISQIGNIPKLLDIMGDNFKTDIEPSMIISLAKNSWAEKAWISQASQLWVKVNVWMVFTMISLMKRI